MINRDLVKDIWQGGVKSAESANIVKSGYSKNYSLVILNLIPHPLVSPQKITLKCSHHVNGLVAATMLGRDSTVIWTIVGWE
jgi:hypothetical protein